MQCTVLLQYTPHSVRIGACILLYEQGKSTVFIKHRLRWKPDTFMDYIYAIQQHWLANTRLSSCGHERP